MNLLTNKTYNINKILDEFVMAYNNLFNSSKVYDEYIRHSSVIGKKTMYKNEEYVIKSIEKSGSIILYNGQNERLVESGDISLKDLYK